MSTEAWEYPDCSDDGMHIMQPVSTTEGQAAAIICGHTFINERDEDEMCEFHGFVQDVLATTVVAEIERLRAVNAQMLAALQGYIGLFDTMANGLEVPAADMAHARSIMRAAIHKATEHQP